MIMSPEHPKWEKFLYKLNVSIEKHGCNGSNTRLAQIILERWDKSDPINVPESIEFFHNNGGYCDCEISLNVGAY